MVRRTIYQDAKRAQAVSAWKDVVEALRNETGTLLNDVYTNPVESKRLFTIEACESKEEY